MKKNILFCLGRKHASWGEVPDEYHRSKLVVPRMSGHGKLDQALLLHRRAKRVHVSLWKYLTQIYPRPHWFMTILFPKVGWVTELSAETPGKARAALDRLHKAFKDRFPRGYLVWTLEFSIKRGLHVHYACEPGEEMSEKRLTKWLFRKWSGICGIGEEDCVMVDRYDHGENDGLHANYLTKQIKLKNRGFLIEHFGRKRTWSKVGGSRIPVQKTVDVWVSESELDVLRSYIIKAIKKKIRKLQTDSSGLVSSKDKMVRKLERQMDKVKSKCSMHCLGDDLRNSLKAKLLEMKNARG